mgnify:FL=1
MSCDKLVFDLSQEVEGSPSVFVKKDWLNILDNQNANYNSNQSVIDTSQLSNSNKYMSYREAYLSMPLLLTLGGTDAADDTQGGFTPATSTASADYTAGLKNWFGTMIHSMTLDYNGTTIIQQTPFCNMWNSFKLMTSMSWGDVHTQGDTIGFYPDDPLTSTATFAATATAVGFGASNNSNCPADGGRPDVAALGHGGINAGFAHYERGKGNIGYIMRQQGINYDPAGVAGAGATNSTLLPLVSVQQLWKSHISNKVDGTNTAGGNLRGCIQWSIVATIYLKHLHAFFASVPLLKGAYMKATLNLNNTTTNFAVIGAAIPTYSPLTSGLSVANSVGGVNPVMLSSMAGASLSTSANGGTDSFAVSGAAPAGGVQMACNVSVGATCLDSTLANQANSQVTTGDLSRSIYLYVPSYTFNPVFEQAYLSSPVKQIKYTDIYQYQINGVGANGLVNNLVTNGIANIKSILILPFYSSSAQTNSGLPAGLPVYQSPFDVAGTGATSPSCLIGNFNVVVSGQNAIYNTQRYAFEQFNNQLYGVNAVNGGMTDGLTSGLVDRLGFDTNYCYYYVDLSRMLPVEESVPKSIQVIGQNMSGKIVDYFVFVEYGVEVSVDALTGVRV